MTDDATRAREIWDELKVTRERCGDNECIVVISKAISAARADAVRPFTEAGLPRTKDGVVAHRGSDVYLEDGTLCIAEGPEQNVVIGPTPSGTGHCICSVTQCYSTREAALAANGGGE